MAKKSRRPATPPPAARFSPAVRLVSGLTALMMVGSLIFVVVAGGRGSDNTPAPVTVPAPKDCPAVDKSDGPRLSFSSRPTWCLDDGATYTAVFDTTEGELRVVLDRERTPETVNNFVVLTRTATTTTPFCSGSTRPSRSSRVEPRRPTTGPILDPDTPSPTRAASSFPSLTAG